jgi:hypothetical protein
MPYVSNFISEMPLFSLIFLEKCTSGAMGLDRSADSGKTSYYDKKIHCPLLAVLSPSRRLPSDRLNDRFWPKAAPDYIDFQAD